MIYTMKKLLLISIFLMSLGVSYGSEPVKEKKEPARVSILDFLEKN